jgi:hypothetical protein
MYRNNWFGGDGWTFYPVTVDIKDTCPICGGKRGKPKENRYYECGQSYYLHNWDNPCGHVDMYKDVYIEAKHLLEAIR